MTFTTARYQTIFKVFLTFAVLYNGYRYFFIWSENKPLAPFYISILKDVPWAIVVIVAIFGCWLLYKGKIENAYPIRSSYKSLSYFFIITHFVLLAVAGLHIFHKNPLDILQRDIKNIQYIFLPLIFPLIIKKEKDISNIFDYIIKLGIPVSLFSFVIAFIFQDWAWQGSVQSTFQSPGNFGFFISMLLLMIVSQIFTEKDASRSRYLLLCLFYAAMLLSISLSSILTLFIGSVLLLIIARPSHKILLKTAAFFIAANIVFLSFGLYNPYLEKLRRSHKGLMNKGIQSVEGKYVPEEEATSLWNFLNRTHHPVAEKKIQSLSQYSTFTGRLLYFYELSDYMKSATFKDVMLGDFSLNHYFEYDNVYFYFIRNDGIIVALLFVSLLGSGIIVGFGKHREFRKTGNFRMAGLSLGVTVFLMTSTFIQFNLSYCLTMYPLNFLTYFFLLLIFFINPEESSSNHVPV